MDRQPAEEALIRALWGARSSGVLLANIDPADVPRLLLVISRGIAGSPTTPGDRARRLLEIARRPEEGGS